MTRASKFRKYKSRHGLENLPNFQGLFKSLWKFAFDCVYEEEVMRRKNNWSWEHMKNHLATCKSYKELYKLKLTSKKLTQSQKVLFHLPVNMRKNLRMSFAERDRQLRIPTRRGQHPDTKATG